jgi:hypothetical protein
VTDILIHFGIGLLGAGTGWYARGFCKHNSHRIALTLGVVFAESLLTVRMVG